MITGGAGRQTLTVAPLVHERVVQRVGAGAHGRAVLAVQRHGQEALAGVGARGRQRQGTHALAALGLDQLLHLQGDPVAPPGKGGGGGREGGERNRKSWDVKELERIHMGH